MTYTQSYTIPWMQAASVIEHLLRQEVTQCYIEGLVLYSNSTHCSIIFNDSLVRWLAACQSILNNSGAERRG